MRFLKQVGSVLGGLLLVIITVAVWLHFVPGKRCTDSSGPTGPGAWESVDRMPTARSEVGMTHDGTRIFIAGGIGLTGWTDAFEMFDVKSARWSKLASMPEPRHHVALAYLEGGVYAAGGYSNLAFTMTDSMWRYDRESLSWESRSPLPEPRAAFTLVAFDGSLYALGGTGPRSDRIWRYDPAEDEWSTLEERILTPREHHAAVVNDGLVYLIGGRWGGNLASIESWDPKTNSWTILPSMPTPRGGITATILDGEIHVFGGEDLTTGCVFDLHEVFEIESGEWSALPPLPTPRHGLQGAGLEGKHWIIGGASRAGYLTPLSARNLVEVFDSTP